jgi:hypothetical protein
MRALFDNTPRKLLKPVPGPWYAALRAYKVMQRELRINPTAIPRRV